MDLTQRIAALEAAWFSVDPCLEFCAGTISLAGPVSDHAAERAAGDLERLRGLCR